MPNLSAELFLTWLTCADQLSRVSRDTRKQRAVWSHCIGSPRNSTGLACRALLAVFAESTTVLFETLIAML
jgi:hypothetical protein